MSRRVVVTGMGAVTPVGNNVEDTWNNIKNGVSGIDFIKKFDASDLKCNVAGEIKDFDAEKYFDKKELKRMDQFTVYAVAAAVQAVEESGLDMEKEDPYRVGVIVSSGIGGFPTIEKQAQACFEKGPKRVSPFFIPMIISNIASASIAMRYKMMGVCKNITTACSSGTHSVGDAFREIKHGYSDVVLAGGAESSICKLGMAGFVNLTALTNSDDPKTACRPFDANRDGFVMADGAGVLVLEEYEHAKKRGAKILGEIVGYGSTEDAYHLTAPLPDGAGAARAMELAMEEAGIEPSQVGYINAHGTSTHANDEGESMAIHTAFGEYAKNVKVSSTKSMTGHMLGAAGAVEAIVAVKACEEGFLPPTINYETPDPKCDLDYIPNKGIEQECEYALSNSFGFGGHNAVICVKKFTE
ncbi:MAG: beta-ketoacyl-ACP synthase II [Lachnospiraceae bacterium]|nr:beta-ketoacyl-ACP synthase II [Lachnospiraceae bacterium]